MNPAHLHLLVNHIPIIGIMLTLPLIALLLFRRSDQGLLLAIVVLLTMSGAGAGAAYVTGTAAEDQIEELYPESESWIEAHEDAAIWGLGFGVLTALVAVGAGGWALRRPAPIPLGIVLLIGGISLFTMAVMAKVGSDGGKIRHPEVRDGALMPEELDELEDALEEEREALEEAAEEAAEELEDALDEGGQRRRRRGRDH